MTFRLTSRLPSRPSIRRSLPALLLAGVVLLLGAAPAWAHDVLVGSDPAKGATLNTAPRPVSLTFDQPVQDGPGFTTMTLTGPGDTRWPLTGVTVDSTVVRGTVGPLGPPGVYTLGYRVLSADGHPVSGLIPFTVTTAGTGQPVPASTAAPAGTSGGSSGRGGGIPVWVWIVGGVVLLGAGVLAAFTLGRPSDQR